MAFKAWRKKQVDLVERRQKRIVNRAVRDMEEVMKRAAEYIVNHFETTKQYKAPDLRAMFQASESFYEDVVRTSVKTANDTRGMQTVKKRMALLPRGKQALDNMFGKSKYWQKIMKRSRKLTERMLKDYQKKLRNSFEQIMPAILDNEMSITEAKEHMVQTWKASRPRVETIFRTETTNYFAQTQVNFFEDDDEIIGFLFDALLDSRTSEICEARHGLVYKPQTELLRQNTPALHYNCRSHLIPLANTPENRKILKDPSRNPKNRKVPPLPPGWGNGKAKR